jgi:multidrug efflux pump
LNVWAPRIVDALHALPELQDVSSDQQDQGLGTALAIDHSTASRLGVSPQTIDDTLYDAFGQRQVSTMFTQLNQYRVVLEVQPNFRQNLAGLRDIYVRGASGGPVVPLSAVTRAEETTAPLAITRQGQFPAVTLSFNLAPGVALGEAVGAIQTATRQLGLPASIQGSFQGTAQAFQASLANELLLIRGGAGSGLPRARRAVRELHPPADDSLHPVVGGCGGDPGADRRAAAHPRRRADGAPRTPT